MNSKHSFRIFQMLFLYACLFFIRVSARCNTDNCLNAFHNHGGFASYSQFCSSFLATTHTATISGLGPFPSQCKDSPSKLSSACSCIASTSSASSKTSPIISTGGSTPTVTITTTVTGTCSATGFPATVTTTVSGTSPTCSASVSTVTSVSLSTTTVTTTPSAQPTCPQLVVNGGFETGSLSNWVISGNNPGATFNVAASSSIPGGSHSGLYSATLIPIPGEPFTPSLPAEMYQSITAPSQLCSAGQSYLFQMFAMTVGNSCVILAYDNGSGISFIKSMLQPGGTNPPWINMSIVITPATSFNLVIEAVCDTMDTVWFDDITLTPV